MKIKKNIFILCCIIIGINFLIPYFKEIKTATFFKTIPSLYTQAQKTSSKDSLKSKFNPFYLISLDTREESLFSGTNGYGPWIEAPFGNMRLISCTSGTKGLKQIFIALQVQIKPNWYILKPEIIPQTFPFSPYRVLYPFTPSYKHINTTYFPIIFYDIPAFSHFHINVISKITACLKENCSFFSIPVDLMLTHQENYPTPICTNLLFNSGVFPKENKSDFKVNIERKNDTALLTFDFYKQTFLPSVFLKEKSITITPLSFKEGKSSFLLSNIPLHLSELNITLKTNKEFFYEKITLPETQRNFQVNFPFSKFTPTTPYAFVFIHPPFHIKTAINKFKIHTSLSTYPLFEQKKLSIQTIPAKKNTDPRAFFFAPKLPLGIEIPISLSYQDIHYLITLFR